MRCGKSALSSAANAVIGFDRASAQRSWRGMIRCPTLVLPLYCTLALGATACMVEEPPICGSLPGTADEIAATPRADENLELLALQLSDGAIADEAIYRRLVRDIAAIRAREPAVREINYFTPFDGSTMNLAFDEANAAAFREGGYHNWDCLNRHYRVVSITPFSGNGVTITFGGRFNQHKLGELYSSLRGVKWAEPVMYVGDGPTIYVTRENDSWHYVFDDATGDCLSGCYASDAWYFVARGNSSPRFIARWISSGGSGAMRDAPEWVQKYLVDAKRRRTEKRVEEQDYLINPRPK